MSQAAKSDKAPERPPPLLAQKSNVTATPVVSRPKEDHRAVVLHYPTMADYANYFCEKYSDHFRHGLCKFEFFPDGWPNIHFEPLQHLQNRDVVYLGSFYDRKTIFEQLSVIMVLPRQAIRSLTIVFPYFAPATMERVDEEGVIATAETLAKIMTSAIPITHTGPATLRIFDIHALPVRFYFHNNVIPRLMTAVPVFLAHMAGQRFTICFPDDGAAKRFKSKFPGIPIIVCSKVRRGNDRIITITDRLNWPADEKKAGVHDHVIVVDDLAQTGGTLNECRLALQRDLKCEKVSAYCTHPVFPNRGYEKFMENGAFWGFHRFYTTNTVPEVAAELNGKAPFEVISVADTLAQEIVDQLSCSG